MTLKLEQEDLEVIDEDIKNHALAEISDIYEMYLLGEYPLDIAMQYIEEQLTILREAVEGVA